LLSDDLTLVDSTGPSLLPGGGAFRLWHAGSRTEGATAVAAIEGQDGKTWFVHPARAAREPVRLEGIVHLRRVPSEAEAGARTLSGQAAAGALLAQTFDLSEAPREWTSARFRNAMTLARQTTLVDFAFVPDAAGEPSHLEALHRAIRNEPRPA
jgi:hypothetical protein